MSAVIGNPLLLGPEGYQISRSVRLRSSASAYFNRTPAGAGTSNKTFTYSAWVKRGSLGSIQNLISSPNTGNSDSLRFSAADALEYNWQDTVVGQVTTTQVFRDPSAWYHIMFAMDTTQATASNRFKLYVNGVQVTAFSTANYPAQNTVVNNTAAVATKLGQYANSSTQNFDGYLTEVNFIDGQALTPSSFGETDTVTGVWKPKKYTGTYGNNGFYLNFSDNSNNTATTIGKDYSGNGNNWTPNNISVTSGVTYDSMLDVPTMWADGGNGRGNYCTWNPLSARTTTLTNGNLAASTTTGMCAGTIAVSSGKWYWECTPTDTTAQQLFGIISASNTAFPTYPGQTSDSYGYYAFNGNKYTGGTATAYGAAYGNNDVIGVALDLDAGTLVFYKNGTSQGTAYSGLSGTFMPAAGDGATNAWVGNFGQRPFTYTPPSGFVALNTQNLPDSTIKAGNKYFDTLLWTSNASVKSVTGSAFQPDLVWVKDRVSASANEGYHHLVDSVRGAGNVLSSNATLAEYWSGTNNSVTAFNSNGFTTGIYDGLNGDSMVTWLWKESAASGFDIVTYTGNGTNRTIAHSLGVAPSMIIIKCRDSATDPSWIVGHTGIVMGTGRLILNGTDANSNAGASSLWNSTAATSSVFSLGTYSSVNQNTLRFVAYLFSEVAGFSRMGSFTGNGSSDGSFVYCGFRPRWIMVKRTDTSGYYWWIVDTARNTYNALENAVYAQASDAETTGWYTDSLANGFKIRNSGLHMNASGGTYIYAAFAENPFKNALAR